MRKNKTLLLKLIFFVALQLCRHSFACSPILLVSSNSHFGIVHRIEATLYAKPEIKTRLMHLDCENVQDPAFTEKYNPSCLIVTIGSEALSAVLKTKTTSPILSVLIRKNIYHFLLQENNRDPHDHKHPIHVIYLDQPLSRQLNFLALLGHKNGKKNIGVLLGPHSINEDPYLHQLSIKKELKLTSVFVNTFENPVGVLDALLEEADMVLAIPDNRIYNPKTTRGMLLTAFHKRVPLVGYSRTYVNNGALAAIYSTTKQLADQTADQILAFILAKDKKMPSSQYPQEFAVAVNYQVARSLGLNIDTEKGLKLKMDQMEKENHGK